MRSRPLNYLIFPIFLSSLSISGCLVSPAGRPGEGLNHDDCHPRASTVRRLTGVLGGSASEPLAAFDGKRCDRAVPSDWVNEPTTDRLWATERDGDVVLSTTGDGTFVRYR